MRRIHAALASLVVVCLPLAARAVAPLVRDEAKLFGPEAVRRANDAARLIMQASGRDLLVETFPGVPVTPGADKVKAMSRDERTKFFNGWASARVDATAANGVYILVCKDPPYVEVEITPKTRPLFDGDARQRLVELLLSHFRQKKYDDGLDAAVAFVRQRLGAVPGK